MKPALRILLGPFKDSRVHGEKYQPKIRESFLTQQFRKQTKTQVFSKGGNFLLLEAHSKHLVATEGTISAQSEVWMRALSRIVASLEIMHLVTV